MTPAPTGGAGSPRVVALGGGHGLAASLAAWRLVTDAVTAVVTVADDGGSSGRLRTELGALPPGDLRMALAALARPDGDPAAWARLVQHRFGGDGPLAGHPVGNLLLAGLAETAGGSVPALDLVARLLGVRGRVLPMCPEPLDIVAEVAGLDPAEPARVSEVRGQVAVATTTGRVLSVALRPERPAACAEAVQAVRAAEWVVLGPGSWFTSVLPHLLVPDLATALVTTAAGRILVLNLAPETGETAGFSPRRHLEVLAEHAPDLKVDVVLADRDHCGEVAGLDEVAATLGGRLVLRPVALGDGSPRHDPARLAAAYRQICRESELGSGAGAGGRAHPAPPPTEGVHRWR